MEGVFKWFGGRKMFFALFALVVGAVAYFLGRMSEPVFVDLLKWILLAYLGSNVLAEVPAIFGGKPPAPQPPA